MLEIVGLSIIKNILPHPQEVRIPGLIGEPPSQATIERLHALGDRVEYVPYAGGSSSFEWLSEKIREDMKHNNWRNRDIGIRGTAISVGGDINVEAEGRIIDGSLVRDIEEVLTDGVAVEYSPLRRPKREMDIMYRQRGRGSAIDLMTTEGLVDHAYALREVTDNNPNIMPCIIVYDLSHPRVKRLLPEDKDELKRLNSDLRHGMSEPITIKVEQKTDIPEASPPILRIYVLNYAGFQ